jgi:hypothetical protein
VTVSRTRATDGSSEIFITDGGHKQFSSRAMSPKSSTGMGPAIETA